MDLIYATLFGIIMKIYDEITDLNIHINPLILESLKSLNIMLFTLIAYNDFLFSFWTAILGLLTYGADNDHWKTFILISTILCILSYTKPESILVLFSYIIVSILLLNIEHKLIPEEVSKKKLISRICFFLFGLFLLYFLNIEYISNFIILYLGNNGYMLKAIGLGVGASFISIISQLYLLYYKDSNQKQ